MPILPTGGGSSPTVVAPLPDPLSLVKGGQPTTTTAPAPSLDPIRAVEGGTFPGPPSLVTSEQLNAAIAALDKTVRAAIAGIVLPTVPTYFLLTFTGRVGAGGVSCPGVKTTDTFVSAFSWDVAGSSVPAQVETQGQLANFTIGSIDGTMTQSNAGDLSAVAVVALFSRA